MCILIITVYFLTQYCRLTSLSGFNFFAECQCWSVKVDAQNFFVRGFWMDKSISANNLEKTDAFINELLILQIKESLKY